MNKVFDTTVPVADPINFGANKNGHLLMVLRDIYEGKCWKGSFIRKITEVVHAGAINIESTNTSARGYVDVQFAADVVVFSMWDILVGVTRSPAFPEMLICEYNSGGARAVVTLAVTKAAETIAIGQRFPARVIMAEHSPMRQSASIVATLLTCDQSAAVVRLSGVLDGATAAPELAALLERVEEELVRRQSLDRKRVRFFERLLYAYQSDAKAEDTSTTIEAWKGGAVWEGPAQIEGESADRAEAVSVVDTVRRAVGGESVDVSGVWSRSLDLYRSSPLVRCADEKVPEKWGAIAESVPRAAFAEYMKNILDFLVCIREMVELYNTPELEKSNANIWAVMRTAQRRG
jgi:hypothetical protein